MPVLDFKSDAEYDIQKVKKKIENAKHLQGNTWTDFALRFVDEHTFSAKFGARCVAHSHRVRLLLFGALVYSLLLLVYSLL